MLRPLAGSLPLGFFAFGTGSILLGAVQPQWVPLAQSRPVMLLVLGSVVPLELLSGPFAFLAASRRRRGPGPVRAGLRLRRQRAGDPVRATGRLSPASRCRPRHA